MEKRSINLSVALWKGNFGYPFFFLTPCQEPSQIPMDAHTLQILEYERLKSLLAERAVSFAGRELIADLQPLTDLDLIRRKLKETGEFCHILNTHGDFPLHGLHDISPILARSRVAGSVLDPHQLLTLVSILRASRAAKAFLKNQDERIEYLKDLGKQLTALPNLEKDIEEKIDESGDLFDHASLALAQIRRSLHAVREQVQRKLEHLIQKMNEKTRQELYITVRDGRYVLPLRQDDRAKIKGVIHDQSASGATVFVEPLATVGLNNQLRQLELDEKKEVARILSELTEMVREKHDQIAVNFQILTYLDMTGAKAKLALDFDCIEPDIDYRQPLKLIESRHILLENILKNQKKSAEKIVANTVDFPEQIYTILITGPNTGGKTVLLKTVGLIALMAQTGLHVPVKEGSRLSVYFEIFADIGDEQSLQQSLSTFSAHMKHIIHFAKNADHESLVLLDELGAGTDPEEGTALSIALMDHFTSKHATTLATTHYGELKVYAHDHPHIINGSMEFNRETLTPAYRFHQNIPGSSYALEIAEKLGMPRRIIGTARAHRRVEDHDIARMIADLEREHHDLAQARKELQCRQSELQDKIKKYEKKLDEIREAKATIKEAALKDAQEFVRQSRQEIKELVKKIKAEKASEQVVQEARDKVEKIQQQVEKKQRKVRQKEEPETIRLTSVQVGDTVRIKEWKTRGTVIEAKDNQHIVVATDSMKFTVSIDKLTGIADSDPSSPVRQSAVSSPDMAEKAISTELDLRGLTAEEALPILDKYIDEAYLASLERLRIIHGKGTGALRQKVTHYLSKDNRVAEHELAMWNEGGSGVTIVKLKMS